MDLIDIHSARRDELDQIIDIHLTEYSKKELSVRLGKKFVRIFYYSIMFSDYAKLIVASYLGEVTGYICVFTNYQEFNNKLFKDNIINLAKIVINSIFKLKINPIDLLLLLNDSKKIREVKNPHYHIGAFSISTKKQFKIVNKNLSYKLMNTAHDYIKYNGANSVWGACDARNWLIHKLLYKFGYKKIDELRFLNRGIFIFEKIF